jgi:hypothetical protein
MDDFKKSQNNETHEVHHSEHHPNGDVNVTVHNAPSGIKTGVLERDWLTALLLSIFLGWFGIDSYYLGKTAKGLLKTFTFGLFGILWFIDIIMIATKSVNNIVWREETGHKKSHKSNNWFANHKVVTGILGFIVFVIIVSAISGGNKTTSYNQPSTTTKATSTPAQAKPAPAAAPKVLLDQSGNGQASTASFSTGDNWSITYTFDCSSYGSAGNFQITINNTDNSFNSDTGANALATSGGSTDHYYDSGKHYLSINSECDWHVTVNG